MPNPHKQYFCQDRKCITEYGAVVNYASSRAGQSMFRFGFAKCVVCNVYYDKDHIFRELGASRCACCSKPLRFKAKTNSKGKRENDTRLETAITYDFL